MRGGGAYRVRRIRWWRAQGCWVLPATGGCGAGGVNDTAAGGLIGRGAAGGRKRGGTGERASERGVRSGGERGGECRVGGLAALGLPAGMGEKEWVSAGRGDCRVQ